MITESDLLNRLGRSWPSRPFLDLFLRLFDGNPVPAIMVRTDRKRWHPLRSVNRRTLFAAHLQGIVLGGNYPYRGKGLGCRHVCFDVDAHNGEDDAINIAVKIDERLRMLGAQTLSCTSKSGIGVHVFAFFDRSIPTREVFAAGTALITEVGVTGRCDVISSADHSRGLGTLHGLPLHPPTMKHGGTLVLKDFKPVVDPKRILEILAHAHQHRMSAERFLEAFPPIDEQAFDTTIPAPLPVTTFVREMVRCNSQFRQILATPSHTLLGKRSVKDARIASALARQGMSESDIVAVLLSIPDSKAADRGERYAQGLARKAHASRIKHISAKGLAGTPCASVVRRTPWCGRVHPPLTYGEISNPWWRSDVRERMAQCRTRQVDEVILAYLIDRWWQVVVKKGIGKESLFEGARAMSRHLKIPPRTVSSSIKRLAGNFPDILHIELGSAHSHLRIANSFFVVGLHPGQSPEDRLYCIRDESCDDASVEHSRLPIQHASA